MANPAGISDVEDRWRPVGDGEANGVQVLLDDAWALVQDRLPTLPARLTAGTLNSRLVVKVLCDMVIRKLRNPEGYTQESKSIDDYTASYTRDGSTAHGALYIADDELRLLRTRTQRAHAQSMRLVRLPPYGAPLRPYGPLPPEGVDTPDPGSSYQWPEW